MSLYGDVGMVLVNWNSSDDVRRTVAAVTAEYPSILTLVVDNGSALEDWSRLEPLASENLVVDRLPSNLGYAAGVNRGLQLAQERALRWAWLMNPDALPYPGCLETLMAASDGCGLLSPQQLSSPKPLDHNARPYVSAARYVSSRLRHEDCPGCSVGFHDVDVVTGTGLLLRVDEAHLAGLMNEDFFHYKEEFEFAERMGAISTVRYVCGAQLWHERGGSLSQTSPQAEYYRVRNELLYLGMRLDSPWRARPRTWRWVARSIGQALCAAPAVRKAMIRGVIHGLRGRSGRAA